MTSNFHLVLYEHLESYHLTYQCFCISKEATVAVFFTCTKEIFKNLTVLFVSTTMEFKLFADKCPTATHGSL